MRPNLQPEKLGSKKEQEFIRFANPYRVLGLQESASTAEIKARYKKLSLAHHPDKNDNDVDASARFQEIDSAYKQLNDEPTKIECDEKLAEIKAYTQSRFASQAFKKKIKQEKAYYLFCDRLRKTVPEILNNENRFIYRNANTVQALKAVYETCDTIPTTLLNEEKKSKRLLLEGVHPQIQHFSLSQGFDTALEDLARYEKEHPSLFNLFQTTHDGMAKQLVTALENKTLSLDTAAAFSQKAGPEIFELLKSNHAALLLKKTLEETLENTTALSEDYLKELKDLSNKPAGSLENLSYLIKKEYFLLIDLLALKKAAPESFEALIHAPLGTIKRHQTAFFSPEKLAENATGYPKAFKLICQIRPDLLQRLLNSLDQNKDPLAQLENLSSEHREALQFLNTAKASLTEYLLPKNTAIEKVLPGLSALVNQYPDFIKLWASEKADTTDRMLNWLYRSTVSVYQKKAALPLQALGDLADLANVYSHHSAWFECFFQTSESLSKVSLNLVDQGKIDFNTIKALSKLSTEQLYYAIALIKSKPSITTDEIQNSVNEKSDALNAITKLDPNIVNLLFSKEKPDQVLKKLPDILAEHPILLSKEISENLLYRLSDETIRSPLSQLETLGGISKRHPLIFKLFFETPHPLSRALWDLDLRLEEVKRLQTTYGEAFSAFSEANTALAGQLNSLLTQSKISLNDLLNFRENQPSRFTFLTKLSPALAGLLIKLLDSKDIDDEKLQTLETSDQPTLDALGDIHPNLLSSIFLPKVSPDAFQKFSQTCPQLLNLFSIQNTKLAKALEASFEGEYPLSTFTTQFEQENTAAITLLNRVNLGTTLKLLEQHKRLSALLPIITHQIEANPELQELLDQDDEEGIEALTQELRLVDEIDPPTDSRLLSDELEKSNCSNKTLSNNLAHLTNGDQSALFALLDPTQRDPGLLAAFSTEGFDLSKLSSDPSKLIELLKKDIGLFKLLPHLELDLAKNFLDLSLDNQLSSDELLALKETNPNLYRLFCKESPRFFTNSAEAIHKTSRIKPIDLLYAFDAWKKPEKNTIETMHCHLNNDHTQAKRFRKTFSETQKFYLFLASKAENTARSPNQIFSNPEHNQNPLNQLRWEIVFEATKALAHTELKGNSTKNVTDHTNPYWDSLERKLLFAMSITNENTECVAKFLKAKDMLIAGLEKAARKAAKEPENSTATLDELKSRKTGLSEIRMQKIRQLWVAKNTLESNAKDTIINAAKSDSSDVENTINTAYAELGKTMLEFAQSNTIQQKRNHIKSTCRYLLGRFMLFSAFVGMTAVIPITLIACLAQGRNLYRDTSEKIDLKFNQTKTARTLFKTYTEVDREYHKQPEIDRSARM